MWHVSCLRGGAGIDAFVLSIFAWALLGFGNVYYALAQRALDKTIAAAKKKSSLALSRSMAYHPEIQHTIAEMVIELESIGPHLDRIAEDWSKGLDYGAEWPLQIFAAEYRAVAEWSMQASILPEVRAFFVRQDTRDARLGRIHPANAFLTHEVVGKTALRISLDEQPRWG